MGTIALLLDFSTCDCLSFNRLEHLLYLISFAIPLSFLILPRGSPEDEKYDPVYIDEAQDFPKEWIQFIFNNLIHGEPKQRNFIIAGDNTQRIYKNRDFRWEDSGIPLVGRSKILRTIYRNSARVWIFSAFLLEDKAGHAKSKDAEMPRFAQKGGYDPQLIECHNLSDQIDAAVRWIKKVSDKG